MLELAAATEGCLYIYGTTYRCDCSWRPLTSTYSKFYISATPVRMAVTFTIFELTLRGKRTPPPVLHPATLLIIVCPQHEAYSLAAVSRELCRQVFFGQIGVSRLAVHRYSLLDCADGSFVSYNQSINIRLLKAVDRFQQFQRYLATP